MSLRLGYKKIVAFSGIKAHWSALDPNFLVKNSLWTSVSDLGIFWLRFSLWKDPECVMHALFFTVNIYVWVIIHFLLFSNVVYWI